MSSWFSFAQRYCHAGTGSGRLVSEKGNLIVTTNSYTALWEQYEEGACMSVMMKYAQTAGYMVYVPTKTAPSTSV